MGVNGKPPKGAKPVAHVPPPTPAQPETTWHKELDRYVGGNSDKFWEVTYPASWSSNNTWTVRWGRWGTSGKTLQHTANSGGAAHTAALVAVQSKIAKGYKRISGGLQQVGQDTAAPSEEWRQKKTGQEQLEAYVKQQAQGSAIAHATENLNQQLDGYTKRNLTDEQLDGYTKRNLTDEQRAAILAMHAAGMSGNAIAATLNVRRQQVAAVTAHATMGTYGPPKQAIGKAAAQVPDATGKRKFNWDV